VVRARAANHRGVEGLRRTGVRYVILGRATGIPAALDQCAGQNGTQAAAAGPRRFQHAIVTDCLPGTAFSRRNHAGCAGHCCAASIGPAAAMAGRARHDGECRPGHHPRQRGTASMAEPGQRMCRATLRRRLADGSKPRSVEPAGAALRSRQLSHPVPAVIDGGAERIVCGGPRWSADAVSLP
jgi:hypothetical protein